MRIHPDNRVKVKPCKDTPMIYCEHPTYDKCAHCGWNPYVDQERKEEMKKRIEEEKENERQKRLNNPGKSTADQSYFRYY